MIKTVQDLLEFEKELEDLIDMCNNGAVIVVEGLKDKRSLRFLGVEGTIIEASNKPADYVAEEVCKITKNVLIFTDSDRSGVLLKKRLVRAFVCRGVLPNTKKSEKMLLLCGVRSVEDLATSYLRSLEVLRI